MRTLCFCLPVLGGKAQTLYRDQVRIEKNLSHAMKITMLLSIDMDIVMQENLEALTPIMSPPSLRSSNRNGRTKILPSIVVYGRKRVK